MKSKFVLAQLEQKGLPEENLENAKKAVAEAMELYKPDLMVFPECFMSHFPMGTDRATCLGTAQTLDGPFVTGMKALAKDNGIWIIFGMNEKVEDPSDDRNYNCTVVINSDGEIVSTYIICICGQILPDGVLSDRLTDRAFVPVSHYKEILQWRV